MEALEIPDKRFFVAVQFHPEYLSRPLRPSPPYVGLLAAASGQLPRFTSNVTNRTKPTGNVVKVSSKKESSTSSSSIQDKYATIEDPELETNSSLFP